MKQSEQDIVDLGEVIASSEVEEKEEEKEEPSNYALDEYLSLLSKVAPMLGEVISPASDIKEAQEGSARIMKGEILGVPQMIAGLASILVPGSQYIRKGGKFIEDKLKGYHATPEENISLIKEKGFNPTGRRSPDADIGVHVALDPKITDMVIGGKVTGKNYKVLPLNINKNTKALEVNDINSFRIPTNWNKAFDGIKTNKELKKDFKKAIDEAEDFRRKEEASLKIQGGYYPSSETDFWSSNYGKVYWLQKLRELGNKHNFDSFIYNNKHEIGTSDANDSLMLLYPNQVDEILEEGKQKVSKVIDDKLKNLNTEEAITSYVIAPDKINRTDLVNKINKDKNIQKKTDEFLNKQGFKEEDTIPIYRVITSNKPNEIIKDEKLISGSLDMKQHLNVFDEFKDKAQYTNVIRYDVPKKNIKVAMEAHKKDIKEKSNKIIKELGYGQNPISGKTIKDIQSEIMGGTKYVDKVENPAKRAKELIEKQGEVIVDVSNVPKKTITSRDAKNFLSNQGEVDLIKEGKIKTYDDYINYIISSQGAMYGGNRQLGQLAREALRGNPGASKKLKEIYKDILIEQADELTDFYNLPRLSIKKQGGMVMRSDNYNTQRAI